MNLGRALALAGVIALGACSFLRPGDPDGEEPSLEREREITEDIAAQIRRSGSLINDPILLGYLDELGQSLVAQLGNPPFFYRFAIIDDEALNAFTIGGGHVYVHRGVFEQAGDLSELAGVLAHEIAHVARRHVAKRQEGQGLRTLLSLAAIAAVAAAGADPEMLLVAEGVNVALQLRNSRSAEAEADYVGVDLLVRSGIAPRGMVRFFERILAEAPAGRDAVPGYLFTHPAVEERIGATRSQIARTELPAGLRARDERLSAMQARLATLGASIAGGSGLMARPAFDRAAAEPALERARRLREASDLEAARDLLRRTGEAAPLDPRIPLLQAQMAEEAGDLDTAATALQRALELDPMVPLTQLELGRVQSLRGEDARALFYLDLAAAGARRGSSLADRAERAIRLVIFDSWQSVELSGPGVVAPWELEAGRPVEVAVRLHPQALSLRPTLRARWIDPAGGVSNEQERRASGGTAEIRLRHTLPPSAPPGEWTLRLRLGESRQWERRVRVRVGDDEGSSAPEAGGPPG